MIETALLVALLAVAIIGALSVLRKGTQDAICSPVGGLHANEGQFGEVPKYRWNEETQSCEAVTAGY